MPRLTVSIGLDRETQGILLDEAPSTSQVDYDTPIQLPNGFEIDASDMNWENEEDQERPESEKVFWHAICDITGLRARYVTYFLKDSPFTYYFLLS